MVVQFQTEGEGHKSSNMFRFLLILLQNKILTYKFDYSCFAKATLHVNKNSKQSLKNATFR